MQARDHPARARLPPRRAEAGQRRQDHHAGAVGDLRRQRGEPRRIRGQPQLAGEPLQKRACCEHAAVQRVGDVARAVRPRDRRQQPGDASWPLGAGEHEHARAVGRLRLPGSDRARPGERRLLVDELGVKRQRPRPRGAAQGAKRAVGRSERGQPGGLQAERVEQLRIPARLRRAPAAASARRSRDRSRNERRGGRRETRRRFPFAACLSPRRAARPARCSPARRACRPRSRDRAAGRCARPRLRRPLRAARAGACPARRRSASAARRRRHPRPAPTPPGGPGPPAPARADRPPRAPRRRPPRRRPAPPPGPARRGRAPGGRSRPAAAPRRAAAAAGRTAPP